MQDEGIVFGVARAVRTCSNLPRSEFFCQRGKVTGAVRIRISSNGTRSGT